MERIIYRSEVTQEDLDALREEEETEGMDEEELERFAVEWNEQWLGDERANLNIRTGQPIICIANLGLWDGRKYGYKVLGCNVNEVLESQIRDQSEWKVFSDGHNVCGEESHHDGTHFYTFRELRRSEADSQHFFELLYQSREPLPSATINRYTKSILPYVADVYGWPVIGRRKPAAAV